MDKHDFKSKLIDYLKENVKKSIINNELTLHVENIKPINSEIEIPYSILILIEDYEERRFRFSIQYRKETEELILGSGYYGFDYAEITHYFYESDNRMEILVNGSFDGTNFEGNINTNLSGTENIFDLIDFTDIGYSQYLEVFVFPVLLRDMNEVQFNWIKENLFNS